MYFEGDKDCSVQTNKKPRGFEYSPKTVVVQRNKLLRQQMLNVE